MNLQAVLTDQNPWWRDPAIRIARQYPVRRDAQARILRQVARLEDRRALVVLGPRQVGKTIMLLQTVDDLLDHGWPAANITYFDFSDERVLEAPSAREVAALKPVGYVADAPRALLLDEVHHFASWDRWLKQAVDRGSDRIVVTDSAASILRGGGRESGLGRWDEIVVEGLTLGEFVRLNALAGEAVADTLKRSPGLADRYLGLGGFPEYATSDDPAEVRRRLRSDVFERAILRDLAGRVFDPVRVRDLFVYLVQQSGGEFVATHRADDLGEATDPRTVRHWVALLEDTFLVRPLPRSARHATARLRSRPKLYAADHGLVLAFAEAPRRDPDLRGQVFEAAVYRHLRDLAQGAHGLVTYYRDRSGVEIDFLIPFDGRMIAVEVTASPRLRGDKLERLRRAVGQSGADHAVLVTGGDVGESSADLSTVPIARFLMAPREALAGGNG